MKGKHPKIVLLGNNSGTNLGDAAILAAVMDSITEELPDAEFVVPSVNPKFIEKHYGDKYNVKPLNGMPWYGSIRLFGINTLYHMITSDVALICDGIIFGKKLFNPAFNMLITLVMLLPWAKLVNCKFVCYSCGIGPFPGFWSSKFARWVINSSSLIIMRDNDNKKLAEEIGVTKHIEVTGDAAFINKVSSKERMQEILQELKVDTSKPLLAVNITSYLDGWLFENDEQGTNTSTIVEDIAAAIEYALGQVKEPFTPIIVSTHPMDEAICNKLANLVGAKVIDNTRYLSHDIQAVMRECQLLAGMRLHSLILASAVESPIVGMIYAPKVRGFMRLIESEEYSIELKDISGEVFGKILARAWDNRRELQKTQQKEISVLKVGARNAATKLADTFFRKAA